MAYALLIGVRSVNPYSPIYNGWDGSAIAKGVTSNISMVTNLFNQLHHSPLDRINTQTLIEPKDITKQQILDQLSRYSTSVNPGDLFIFYFSGHGGQTQDRSHECLACYDDNLWDFELKAIWKQFKPGVRIVMIADACHSGTTDALLNKFNLNASSNIGILSHDPDRKNINAMLIYYSPIDDNGLSFTTAEGSFFTQAIINVMNHGKYQGNYKTFYEDIKKEVTRLTAGSTDDQEKPIVLAPQYDELGPNETIAFQRFREQKPFTVDFPKGLLSHVSMNVGDRPSFFDNTASVKPETANSCNTEIKSFIPRSRL